MSLPDQLLKYPCFNTLVLPSVGLFVLCGASAMPCGSPVLCTFSGLAGPMPCALMWGLWGSDKRALACQPGRESTSYSNNCFDQCALQ
eukprot:scaffold131574_cov15-Tisochrysis_lutea.AAC.1